MARILPPGTPKLAAKSPRRLSGVVLLVEDDLSVRTVTRRMMEMRGLTVLLAETPEEGLRLATHCPHPLEVLLTDVQLPEMEGPELAGRIRGLHPNVKVVYISGYAREENLFCSPDDDDAEYLQKPFTQSALTEILARALGQTGNQPQDEPKP